LVGEDAGPLVVAHLAGRQALHDDDDGEQRHQDGGGALHQPVAQAVVRADDDALGSVVVRHFGGPRSVADEQLVGEHERQHAATPIATSADVRPNSLS
jgi:hypothetical protein